MNQVADVHRTWPLRICFLMFFAAMAAWIPSTPCQADEHSISLRFSFDGAAWKDVIRWVAEESGMAMHVDRVPPGSFTYMDETEFSPAGAISRINLFLIPQGYAIVQQGNLLTVVELADPRGRQQLMAIAQPIQRGELDQLDDHQIVRCLFRLKDLDADDAVTELAGLQLMTPPTVLNKTNQLMIVDTVAQLRSVRNILESFSPETMDNGTIVQSFALKFVQAEDVLVVARPHLGLATGEMIGIDVSISADVLGKHLFVTGVEDKVKLVEGLVKAIDQPDTAQDPLDGDAVLQSHFVEGGNIQMVYDVLQTLLAERSVRLSMDPAASSVVAYATADVQEEISATVEELKASMPVFEVIDLNTVDPFYAITLLEQMLDLTPPLPPRKGEEAVDPLEIPRIDADPGMRRLFVRAKPAVMKQIKSIVEQIDSGNRNQSSSISDSLSGATVRYVPLDEESATQILPVAAQLWRRPNPIIVYPKETGRSEVRIRVPSDDVADVPDQRSPWPKSGSPMRLDQDSVSIPTDPDRERGKGKILTSKRLGDSDLSRRDGADRRSGSEKRTSPIHCQYSARGLMLESSDTSALQRFEQQVLTLTASLDGSASPPTLVYLKYIKATDALNMLAKLLRGGETAKESESGVLINGYVSSFTMRGLADAFVSTADGTMTLTAGTMTVVADARLNRLIVQGARDEVATLETYLEMIDDEDGVTNVQIDGEIRIFGLQHTRAEEVAKVVREAFAGRIRATSDKNSSGGKSSGSAASKPEFDPAMFAKLALSGAMGGSPKTPSKTTRGSAAPAKSADDLEPKMTVAVHEESNSLVVTAPPALMRDAASLIESIDTRSETKIEVLMPSNLRAIELALQGISSANVSTTRDNRSNSATNGPDRSKDRSRDRGSDR
ncbi:MAG: secretin N-terminal domain-containing protein [Planctomycetota bacterium]